MRMSSRIAIVSDAAADHPTNEFVGYYGAKPASRLKKEIEDVPQGNMYARMALLPC